MSATTRVLLVPTSTTSNVDDTRASLTFMLIGAIFASLLIPMFICLICFSTPESRRRVLFILNGLTLVFGILQGVVLVALSVRSILEPHSNLSGLSLAVNIVFLFSPLLVESILLLRLVAVFPSRMHGRRVVFAILAFPITVRIGRLVNMCLAIARLAALSSKLQNNTSQWWALLPYIRVEWSLALVDNTYVSLVFLNRLRTHVPAISHKKTNAMAARIRRLFFIAVSNFLIPGLLNLIQLILAFVLPNHNDSKARQSHLFFICAYIMIVFNYVCIIGIVFATIWSTGTSSTGWSSISNASVPYSAVASPTPRQSAFNPQTSRGAPTGGRTSEDYLSVPLIGGESSPENHPRSEGEKASVSQPETRT